MKPQICTHCKAPIVCAAEEIENCDCQKLTLRPETIAFLGTTFHKCLCNSCLKKMDEMVAFSLVNEFPKRRSEMVEGVHYYIENEYFVFTEQYHLMKGQCCQNGCRHCVYGFKNQFL